MVAQRSRPHISIEEWRALERSSEMKHEYIDGVLHALAGGSRAHSLLMRPCRVHRRRSLGAETFSPSIRSLSVPILHSG